MISMYMYKNIFNKTLKKCSNFPLTGYTRDGYCKPNESDLGKHLVCGIMNKKFLDYSAKQNNNLYGVTKPGNKWCLCVNRYKDALINDMAPKIDKRATHKNALLYLRSKGGRKTKKKSFLYNPNNPKLSFDVYIDKNPNDTISIKYTTINDVKQTIRKLERLFKNGSYSHKRIWQVAMIMKVRLEAIKKHKKTLYKGAKNVNKRFNIANSYYNFLKKRTKLNPSKRKTFTFYF